MTTKELKEEIQKVLDEVPENRLENILSYLKEIKKSTTSETTESQYLKKILTEDRELLKKLAQ